MRRKGWERDLEVKEQIENLTQPKVDHFPLAPAPIMCHPTR